jgi:hypothetical protein
VAGLEGCFPLELFLKVMVGVHDRNVIVLRVVRWKG